MAKVEINKVRKSFGNTEVLHEVNLTVVPGEFVVLVGPSGCGKSTLLRMVAGLDVPTSGSISIDGNIVNDVPPKERGVSMVFQNYALYPHMTVRNNLEFGLKIAGIPIEEINKRVEEASTILGLTTQLEKKPGQLSGGQKQRVAMGRAMVRQPKVFLFDEPLSNLDAQLRVKMRSEISLLHRRLKSTSIYVTHDQVEAMTLADRIAVMYKGKLEQVGTPLELYRNPQTQFVASFIGTPQMNFVKKDLLPKALTPATAVTAGFRPEVTKIEKPAAQESVSLGKSVVALVEPLGLTSYLHLKLGEETIIAETRTEHLPNMGSEIPVWINPNQLYFFDGAGARV